MPFEHSPWTLRESPKHGLTADLIAAFRQRAAAEDLDVVEALVRLMRQYIDSPIPQRQDTDDADQQPPHEY